MAFRFSERGNALCFLKGNRHGHTLPGKAGDHGGQGNHRGTKEQDLCCALKWTKPYLLKTQIIRIPDMMHGESVMMHQKESVIKTLVFLQ